jgi:clan AA aspartic protease (TIGR02281 family)
MVLSFVFKAPISTVVRKSKIVALIILCIFAIPSLLIAEFYKWKDEQGSVHFTDNYHNIPEQYRKKVSKTNYGKKKSTKKLSKDTPQRVVVHFEKQDNAIFVNAVLNWKHPVIFHVDTGATSTMITKEDALALGINPDTKPTTKGYIADGSVVEFPVAVLSSIRVGEAEVNDVVAAIGKMRLLGMNFLNSFKVDIDAKNGQMVLERTDSVKEKESPSIRAEKDYTVGELENEIEQIEIAASAQENVIKEIEADIRQNEAGKARVESVLKNMDSGREKKKKKLEETLARFDRNIELQKSEIAIRQKQIEQLRDRITYYDRMIEKMR